MQQRQVAAAALLENAYSGHGGFVAASRNHRQPAASAESLLTRLRLARGPLAPRASGWLDPAVDPDSKPSAQMRASGEYGVSWIARREPCLRVGAAFAATAFAWLPTSDTSSLSAERLVAASAAGRVLVSAAAQHGAISAGLRVTGQPSVNRTILQPRSAVR
jgi:hypothetical protein